MNAHPPPKATARTLGCQLVLTGLLVNQWSVAWLVTDDMHLASSRNVGVIWAGQALCVLVGLAFLAGWRPVRIPRLVRGVAAVVLTLIWITGSWGTLRARGIVETAAEAAMRMQIGRLNASETVHLNLGTERLAALNDSLANLRIPADDGFDVLAEEVTVIDLDPAGEPWTYKTFPSVGTTIRKWKVEDTPRTMPRADVNLLAPFLEDVAYLDEGSKFYFIGGDFVGDDFSRWEVRAGFTAFGKLLHGGGYVKATGKLTFLWVLDPGLDPHRNDHFTRFGSWRIAEVALQSFKTLEAPNILFREELDHAVPDVEARDTARRNIAQEMIVDMAKAQLAGEDWEKPHSLFNHAAATENPSVSVVDIDRDGFDDFYTMPRYGKNQFFLNNGDGTFREAAEEMGLDFENYCTTAIFADFDNDGDDDLFLGRSFARSMYLVNEGGVFQDRSEELFGDSLPYFAMTAAAADYDADGLLDLYIGTYTGTVITKYIRNKGVRNLNGRLFPEFLPAADARELFRRYGTVQTHGIRDRAGPPNVLVHNEGNGEFRVVDDSPLHLFRNTYQATFADYDGDGDADVYVANDFAPNYLFRNDDGVFVDQTAETNAADIGFGMGISWGDYDRDGDQDAYVSNMFSKAGTRILPMVSNLDDRFMAMASGNSLLELRDGRFERVSSLEGQGMHVEMGGWSWGSQFVDFDNDAWLDLYALSGYYSAPREIRAGHDL